MTIISPSILAANLLDIKSELIKLEEARADMLHLDIMDGHYVPNMTFGSSFVKAIDSQTTLPLDVHLMIENPEQWIGVYAQAGADIITIHPKTTKHLHRTIMQIKEEGCKVGIAILPSEDLSVLQYVLDEIDLILIMSVNPGFGGQKFISSQLGKIEQAAKLIKGRNILLSVDGGINDKTAPQVLERGANMLVSGSYIFSGDYRHNIETLRASGV